MRHARKHAKAMQKIERQSAEGDHAEFIARRMACGVDEQQAEQEYDKLYHEPPSGEGWDQ